jgi:hypothetical protein
VQGLLVKIKDEGFLDAVRFAVTRHRERLGCAPTICYAHPQTGPERELQLAGGVRYEPRATVAKGYVWLVRGPETQPPAQMNFLTGEH